MRFCQVGCDMDGVLVDGFIPPESDFAIISGRHTDDWERTLRQAGTARPIYLRPPFFPGESGEWKAAMILALGITKFYEDMRDQAEVIRRCCRLCAVHMVKDGRVIEILKS